MGRMRGLNTNGGRRQRFVERVDQRLELVESEGEEGGGPRRVRAVGITADVINANGRRYPRAVLEAAIEELRGHLHESAGQGRLMVQLLGEAEHPSDKSTGRPNLLETVVVWDRAEMPGDRVILEGSILGTSKGRDVRAIIEGGVQIGVSQRAWGESRTVREGGRSVEEITELHITGYDLVLEPSDANAGIEAILESAAERSGGGVLEMDFEELLRRLREEGIFEELAESVRGRIEAAQRQRNEERQMAALRSALGAQEGEDLIEAARRLTADREIHDGADGTSAVQRELKEARARLAELEEAQAAREVAGFLEAEVAKVRYPDWLRKRFGEAVQAAGAKTMEEAKGVLASKREEYDKLMADLELASRGFSGVQVLGPVLERETGTPEFARGAFEFHESLIRSGHVQRRDLRQPKTINEVQAAEVLRRFDELYKVQLGREARLMQEAEQTTDLNLPYSVSRAILQAVWPTLISTGIFDVGVTDQAPSRVYYEAYEGEAGAEATVTAETIAASNPLGTFVAAAHSMMQPGTITVTNSGGGTTYTEGTDYVVDYMYGELKALATGSIGAGDSLRITYTYDVVREGEMAAIQRGKMTLDYATLEIEANRLAQQITNEAVVFARSQIGWDATTRTLASLVNQLRRRIDKNLMYNALSASLSVATNSGGTWTAATDPVIDLVSYVGVSRVKVAARFYEPTGILMSLTNSDRIGNWDGFTAAGQRPDSDLQANGYVGRIKGLPAFASTEFSDSYVLVMNREIVMYRVFQPMTLKGPYPTYSTTNLVAADQWYAEQYDGAVTPVANKASHVVVA